MYYATAWRKFRNLSCSCPYNAFEATNLFATVFYHILYGGYFSSVCSDRDEINICCCIVCVKSKLLHFRSHSQLDSAVSIGFNGCDVFANCWSVF